MRSLCAVQKVLGPLQFIQLMTVLTLTYFRAIPIWSTMLFIHINTPEATYLLSPLYSFLLVLIIFGICNSGASSAYFIVRKPPGVLLWHIKTFKEEGFNPNTVALRTHGHFLWVFSSPEPKAHGELIVYQSSRRLSVCLCVCVCVCSHFQT